LNTKLLEIIKIQTFYIVYFFIWESLSKQYSPNLESHKNNMKLYVRLWIFNYAFPTLCQMKKMVSILNVDLDEWNNIGIHDFSSRDTLGLRKPVHGYEFFQNSKLSASNLGKWPIWWLQMKQFFKYKVVRDHQDLYLIHCPFFHLDKV